MECSKLTRPCTESQHVVKDFSHGCLYLISNFTQTLDFREADPPNPPAMQCFPGHANEHPTPCHLTPSGSTQTQGVEATLHSTSPSSLTNIPSPRQMVIFVPDWQVQATGLNHLPGQQGVMVWTSQTAKWGVSPRVTRCERRQSWPGDEFGPLPRLRINIPVFNASGIWTQIYTSAENVLFWGFGHRPFFVSLCL